MHCGLASGVVLPGLLFFFFLLFFLFASRRLMFKKLDLCQKETAFLQRARLGALLESRVYLEQIW